MSKQQTSQKSTTKSSRSRRNRSRRKKVRPAAGQPYLLGGAPRLFADTPQISGHVPQPGTSNIRKARARRRNEARTLKLNAARTDPIGALQRCRHLYRAAQRGLRRQVREIMQLSYVVALAITKDKKLWSKFVRDVFWDDHKGRSPEKADRCDSWLFIVAFVEEASSETARKRASKHAAALRFLADEGIKSEHIAETIRNCGGIEKLAREAAKVRARHNSSSADQEGALSAEPGAAPRDVETGRTDDQETASPPQAGLEVSTELAEKISGLRGRRTKIIAKVVSQPRSLRVKVVKVVALKKKKKKTN